MFEWLFGNKKEFERVERETKQGFDKVREDILNISKWIKHLDDKNKSHKNEISEIKENLSSIEIEIEGLKNMISLIGSGGFKQSFKTAKQVFNKQTAVVPVQTAVQTAVQTPNLSQFSISEKAIIWLLLNSDMKLSYEDIAAMTGKEKTTIRGQINSIRQKNEGLIEEIIGSNNKKRVFIPEKVKEVLLKTRKVREKAKRESENS